MDLTRKVTRDELRARVAAQPRRRAGAAGQGQAPLRADRRRRQGGRRGRVGRARLRLREGALRLRLEAHHEAGQQAARPRTCSTPTSRSATSRSFSGSISARALDGRTANVVATLKGTVNPELIYVVSSHYDSVADRPRRRRRHAAARRRCSRRRASWPDIRSRRRSSSRRSPARKRACSAAASSCAGRSPTSCRSSARSTTT